MTKLFSWKQNDSLGVVVLDRQHQELFDTAQQLYDALTRADGVGVAEDIFSRLMDYSSHHFADEEVLMQQHHYPRLKSHQAEHRSFSYELMNFRKEFRAGNQSVVSSLLPYLQHWIKNHTQGADLHFAEFMKPIVIAKGQSAGGG